MLWEEWKIQRSFKSISKLHLEEIFALVHLSPTVTVIYEYHFYNILFCDLLISLDYILEPFVCVNI